MLKSIDYTVSFKSTLRTLKESINFQTGFGTITGPNESGKSFVIEMVRWCLFGASALRGTATEYAKAKATLRFAVKGVDYCIERTPNSAKIFKGVDEIAVGTTPTNNKVVEILGFGLQVFDVACVVNQGEIEALGTMKPAQRKRMVDSVVGLGVIDDLAKYAGEEGATSRRYAEELLSKTHEPIPPMEPEGYQPSAVLQEDVNARLKSKERISFILGRLSQKVSEPTAPKEEINVGAEELAVLVAGQNRLKQQLQQTRMDLNTLPNASPYSTTTLDAMEQSHAGYNAWAEKKALASRMRRPTHTPEAVLGIEQAIHQRDQWNTAEGLRKRIAALQAKGTNCCPACAHEWALEADAIEALSRDLAPLSSVEMPQGLKDTLATVAAYKAEQASWDALQPAWLALADVAEAEKPALSLADIETHRNRNAFAAKRDEATALVAALTTKLADQPDYTTMYNKRVLYEQQFGVFQSTLRRYWDWLEEEAKLEEEKAVLQEAVDFLPGRQNLLALSLAYEREESTHGAAMQAYMAVMQEVQEYQAKAEDWDKVKVALTSLKAMVKQHLMPSLNKVASYYLLHMTGGQRQTIFVDEEFNVSVDGQALHTLSGSGKAVANLAMRIGLGQILTNNVFSLFVGDEIDAAMDKDRAEHTAVTLQTLKSRISQILLVTHKFPTADYYITVGDPNATETSES